MPYDLRTIVAEAREEVRRREAECDDLRTAYERTKDSEDWRRWSDADNDLYDFVQANLIKAQRGAI